MNKKSLALATITAMSLTAACTEDPNNENNMTTPRINNAPIRPDMDMGVDMMEIQEDMSQKIDATMDMTTLPEDMESDLNDQSKDMEEIPLVNLSAQCETLEGCQQEVKRISDEIIANGSSSQLITEQWGAGFIPVDDPSNVFQEGTDEQPELMNQISVYNPNGKLQPTGTIVDKAFVLLPKEGEDYSVLDSNCLGLEPCEISLKLHTITPENSKDLFVRVIYAECPTDSSPSTNGVSATPYPAIEGFETLTPVQELTEIDQGGCEFFRASVVSKTGVFLSENIREVYPDYRGEQLVFGTSPLN